MLVKLAGVHAQSLVETGALVVIQVHGDVDRQAEEARPHLGLKVIDHLFASLEDGCQEIAVPVGQDRKEGWKGYYLAKPVRGTHVRVVDKLLDFPTFLN